MARHATPAERRAAMRTPPDEDPEFQIAPMIDILLVLLVFFMSIASTEVLQSNDAVRLPVAKDAKEKDKKATEGQSMINVLWGMNNQGTIEMDGKTYNQPGDLVPMIEAKVKGNPAMRVLVRADKDVRYVYLRALLKAVAQAGVGNVTFSVVDKESAPPAPTTASL